MRSLQSELIRNKIVEPQGSRKAKKDTKPNRKSKEQFTRSELDQLMGRFMDTYNRGKGGAIRRR